MLFSTIIGNKNLVSNEWKIVEDRYGNSIITNPNIKQNIRIGKNVSKDLDMVYDRDNNVAYNIGTNTFISNNYSNMKLSLMNFWSSDEEVMKLHTDDHIMFLTLDNRNYRLIGYSNCGNEIVQTYKNNGIYQGCAFIFKSFDDSVFKLRVEDLKLREVVELVVGIDEDGYVFVARNTVRNNRPNNRFVHFKISTDSGKVMTKAYITDADSKETALELTKDVKGAEIVVLEGNGDRLTNNDVRNIENIIHDNTRAITLIGTDVPKDFCKKYKILYLFKYFDDNGELRCLRSN